MKITHYPIFATNPSNPARVNMVTGEIEINDLAWAMYTPDEQEVLLEHEKGHFLQNTNSEEEADLYALKQLALKKPYSLWNHYRTIKKVSRFDNNRVNTARKRVLEIAANDGSTEAKQLLKTYSNANGKNYKTITLILIVILLIVIIWKTIKH